MPWILRVVEGSNAGQRIALAETTTVLIGRGEDCGLRLSDPGASRVHCRIVSAAGRAFIEDAASRWGTLVNGTAIDTQELQPGDRIVIGDTELSIELDSPEAITQPPARHRPATPSPFFEHAPAPVRAAQTLNPPPRTVNFPQLVGQPFLRFRVGNMVARTRSGAVYRAFDPGRASHNTAQPSDVGPDERVIALKVFSPESLGDEQSKRRFVRAIRAMLPLQHEHLVRLYTAGRWHGLCFAASEFVEGESVTQVIQRVGIAGMLDWRRAWQLAVAIAGALEYAHGRGILHRNVTPGHILIGRDWSQIKLGDLMLAKALDDCGERITRPGEFVGNLRYLAPEQLAGDGWVDHRADVYSLGATLYAVLTGRPPFDGATTGEIVHAVLTGRVEPPSRLHMGIPPAFEGVVLRMMARSPDERFASASEVLRQLERISKYVGSAP